MFVDQWSACPSLLLAWSFAFLPVSDVLRCRAVCHAWQALLTSHPLSPVCLRLLLAGPACRASRWSTRALLAVFRSLPLLTALSFSPLDEAMAQVVEAETAPVPLPPAAAAATVNGLAPVALPSAVVNPRTAHLHSVFALHHLRVLLLPVLRPALSNADLFAISAHLPLLEVLTLSLPSSSAASQSLSAVGFAHLSVMQHLAHLAVEYYDMHDGRSGSRGGDRCSAEPTRGRRRVQQWQQ